jgi:uncharacterized repeat protein (TIGR03809 family)
MSRKLQIRDTGDIARRWHALAERRREHFADLRDSGRWRKYYREHNFLREMRESARLAEAWSKVVHAHRSAPI